MGDRSMYYHFYLNNPLEKRAIQEMYEEIRDKCPYLRFSHPLEALVDYTWDSSHQRWKDATPSPELVYRGYLEIGIQYSDDNYDGSPTEPEIVYYLKHSRLQLVVDMLSWRSMFYVEAYDEPEQGRDIFDFISTVARHTDPIVGLFNSEAVFGWPNESFVSSMEYLRYILRDSPWGSIYLDRKLSDDIGLEWLGEWADVLVPVDNLGYMVEVWGYLLPRRDERPHDTRAFEHGWFNRVMPRIIERLADEYGYMKNSFGKYV